MTILFRSIINKDTAELLLAALLVLLLIAGDLALFAPTSKPSVALEQEAQDAP